MVFGGGVETYSALIKLIFFSSSIQSSYKLLMSNFFLLMIRAPHILNESNLKI